MKIWIILVTLWLPVCVLAQGKVGINTDSAIVQLDIRALSNSENTLLNLGTPDGAYFTRFLAGNAGFPASSVSWTTGIPFNFGMWDGMTFTQLMQLSPARRVGINTFAPSYTLDVRGTDNDLYGGELQLATPDETNFIRMFGGRVGDRHPFIAFHDLDTFHIVTTLPDWSTYARRLTILPTGNVGIGTEVPDHRLSVYTAGLKDTAVMGESGASGIGADPVGVYGKATGGTGVVGQGREVGVRGEATYGVVGYADSTHDDSKAATGVFGQSGNTSGNGYGVRGSAVSNSFAVGVSGVAFGSSVSYGIYGQSFSPVGRGVYGYGNTGVMGTPNDDEGVGVYGLAHDPAKSSTVGVRGQSMASSGGRGVEGIAPYSGTGRGVYAQGYYGVHAQSGGGGIGVLALASGGTAVRGSNSAGSGVVYGVEGYTLSSAGYAIYGHNTATSGSARGVYGRSNSSTGRALEGRASASTGLNYGLYAESLSTSGRGVFGYAQAVSGSTVGVAGSADSPSGTGVRGNATALTGSTYGVHGVALSADGTGVYGEADGANGVAVHGYADGLYGKGVHAVATGTHSSVNAILADANNGSAYAGYFIGRVNIAGNLAKSSGSFKIDHPLDPENKYLYHSFVESPDMMNIYNGNVTTDSEGFAEVELPDYFEALNIDFRYQLTVIGSFAQAIIYEEVSGNRFSIMTDKPNIKVSWMVTGVRNDAYAKTNRIKPEVTKEPENQGKYLNPEVFGQSEDMRIGRN